MIAKIAVGVVLAVVVTAGIGAYLSPDDLSDCKSGPSEESSSCRVADAIVVVSGGDTRARTSEAINLYESGWASLIVFSGAAADKDGPSNAAVMREQAMARGVPAGATIIEDASETTRQNAEEVATRLAEHGIEDVILVTSGYHMRRAGLEFSEQLGAQVALRRHPVAADAQWSSFWWATPYGWTLAVGELVKIGAFYLGGSR